MEWNPLDVKPTGEMTFYGDARPLDEFREGQTIQIDGSFYRVTGITDHGDSVTYKVEAAWLET